MTCRIELLVKHPEPQFLHLYSRVNRVAVRIKGDLLCLTGCLAPRGCLGKIESEFLEASFHFAPKLIAQLVISYLVYN